MAELQQYVRPHMLYRYRSLEFFERELRTIEAAYLYCPRFADLNDPMEGLFTSTRRVRESDDYRAIRRAIIDNKSETGICSFSEVYDHELMWAHYANKYAGICIGYSFSRLLQHLPADVAFVIIYYNEQAPAVRRRSDDPAVAARKILSQKNHRWLYEREWRMFGPVGRVEYHDVDCVTRVYLGSRITPVHRDGIKRRLSQLGISVHEMTVTRYSLTFERCNLPDQSEEDQ